MVPMKPHLCEVRDRVVPDLDCAEHLGPLVVDAPILGRDRLDRDHEDLSDGGDAEETPEERDGVDHDLGRGVGGLVAEER